nr:hypothetical protein [Tanacetum cinerariifolium]
RARVAAGAPQPRAAPARLPLHPRGAGAGAARRRHLPGLRPGRPPAGARVRQ